MQLNTLVIIHFNPVELYPPVLNILDHLSLNMPLTKIYVFTNATVINVPEYVPENINIKIVRFARLNPSLPAFFRYMNYFKFYRGAFKKLKSVHPQWVWLYETLSVMPAKWYFKRQKYCDSKLFISYHEYSSLAEYNSWLLRLLHSQERMLFPLADFISHTNEKRMELFLKDNALPYDEKKIILPNYPSRKWYHVPKASAGIPLKIIYVGAFSLDTMYVKEFAAWVQDQKGSVTWDIFSYNYPEAAKNYIYKLNSEWIQFKSSVDYTVLPAVIKEYDVGVILYKGHNLNYVYNAPNKLFEYLACGLDVWFPDVMVGSLSYVTHKTYPKVLAVDFTRLQHFRADEAIDREGVTFVPPDFFYETVLSKITRQMLS